MKNCFPAAEEADEALWAAFVSSHGLLHDYVGELPTPEDCRDCRPNAMGWWSPIENGPMFTGQYLVGLCHKARRTGDARDAERCRRLAEGLLLCAEVPETPGMICRGVGSDGRCHYPLGSTDQTLPWFEGLDAFPRSGLCAESLRKRIVARLVEIGNALKRTGWRMPCDGKFSSEFRGEMKDDSLPFRGATAYLFVLRALADATGDWTWRSLYRTARDETYSGLSLTRLEVCECGYRIDTEDAGFKMEPHLFWIYTPASLALRELANREEEPMAAAKFRAGLDKGAVAASRFVLAAKDYPNTSEHPFKYANWRQGWIWRPQSTQKEAEAVAGDGNPEVLGTRKELERRTMTAPLAAAVICACAGRNAAEIAAAVTHYDYSTPSLCEFFLAPLAVELVAAAKGARHCLAPSIPMW